MYLVVFLFTLFTQKFFAFKPLLKLVYAYFYPVRICVASLALPPLRKEEGSGDTLIREPVTGECNGVAGLCV